MNVKAIAGGAALLLVGIGIGGSNLDSGSQHFEINATPNNSWSITIEELR